MTKPDCYKCGHRRSIPGDAHSQCVAPNAKVKGHKIGIKGGWFFYPFNFDPTWLLKCDSFSPILSFEDKMALDH